MERSNVTKWSCFHKVSSDNLSEISKAGFVRKILLSKLRGSSHNADRTDRGMRRTRDIRGPLVAPCAGEIMQLCLLPPLPSHSPPHVPVSPIWFSQPLILEMHLRKIVSA